MTDSDRTAERANHHSMTSTVVHFDDSRVFGGAEQAALHVLAGLDRRRWRPVLFHHAEPGVAPMVDRARSLGVEVRSVPPVWTRAEARRGLLPFVRALRAERPAVFHAHLTTEVGCKYGLIAAALARIPAVVGTVQLLFEVAPSWRYDASQRIVTACIDRYIAVSQAIARRLHVSKWRTASRPHRRPNDALRHRSAPRR